MSPVLGFMAFVYVWWFSLSLRGFVLVLFPFLTCSFFRFAGVGFFLGILLFLAVFDVSAVFFRTAFVRGRL